MVYDYLSYVLCHSSFVRRRVGKPHYSASRWAIGNTSDFGVSAQSNASLGVEYAIGNTSDFGVSAQSNASLGVEYAIGGEILII